MLTQPAFKNHENIPWIFVMDYAAEVLVSFYSCHVQITITASDNLGNTPRVPFKLYLT